MENINRLRIMGLLGIDAELKNLIIEAETALGQNITAGDLVDFINGKAVKAQVPKVYVEPGDITNTYGKFTYRPDPDFFNNVISSCKINKGRIALIQSPTSKQDVYSYVNLLGLFNGKIVILYRTAVVFSEMFVMVEPLENAANIFLTSSCTFSGNPGPGATYYYNNHLRLFKYNPEQETISTLGNATVQTYGGNTEVKAIMLSDTKGVLMYYHFTGERKRLFQSFTLNSGSSPTAVSLDNNEYDTQISENALDQSTLAKISDRKFLLFGSSSGISYGTVIELNGNTFSKGNSVALTINGENILGIVTLGADKQLMVYWKQGDSAEGGGYVRCKVLTIVDKGIALGNACDIYVANSSNRVVNMTTGLTRMKGIIRDNINPKKFYTVSIYQPVGTNNYMRVYSQINCTNLNSLSIANTVLISTEAFFQYRTFNTAEVLKDNLYLFSLDSYWLDIFAHDKKNQFKILADADMPVKGVALGGTGASGRANILLQGVSDKLGEEKYGDVYIAYDGNITFVDKMGKKIGKNYGKRLCLVERMMLGEDEYTDKPYTGNAVLKVEGANFTRYLFYRRNDVNVDAPTSYQPVTSTLTNLVGVAISTEKILVKGNWKPNFTVKVGALYYLNNNGTVTEGNGTQFMGIGKSSNEIHLY